MPLKFLFKCNQTKLEIANINVCSPNEEGAKMRCECESRWSAEQPAISAGVDVMCSKFLCSLY